MSKSEVFNEDCMIGMRRYPDKYFDLAHISQLSLFHMEELG